MNENKILFAEKNILICKYSKYNIFERNIYKKKVILDNFPYIGYTVVIENGGKRRQA